MQVFDKTLTYIFINSQLFKTMKKQTMGARIQALREAYSLTQSGFAKKINIAGLTVGNLERGVTQSFQPDTLNEIVKVFGTTRDWLETGKGEMLPNGPVELTDKTELISDSPWKDEAYQVMKQENTRLWEMLNKFMNGEINFLQPVNETAYSATGTFN